MKCVFKTREGHAYIPRATEGGAFSVTGSLATSGTATPQGEYPLTLSEDKTVSMAFDIVWYAGC